MRIAIDTGGTFTDCVWVHNGRLRMLKVFSTPRNPSQAIVEGITRAIRESGGSVRELIVLHGTTVGTNAVLERRGARVAFVTTAGFEDSIEIGRQARPKLYDFFFERQPPLVDCDLRFGIRERTAPTGEIVISIQAEALEALCRALMAAAPEAIAVSTLFSFANSQNECAIADALARALPDVPISLSHKILPEFREYERASTVVMNAYLEPLMQRYLRNLGEQLAVNTTPELGRPNVARDVRPKSQTRVFVMQSSGGITSLESAASEPVRTVLSGPAGGVVGAAAMGRRSGFANVIGFDMGGTSTDVALVAGELRPTVEGEIAGLPVRVPMLDIHTVGAGGGSLARFDPGGALRVGPESAGADPGPICYGKGEQPTVTDANLLLGRLQPDAFLGGEFTLEVERTRRIVREWLKQHRSRMSVEEFAAGVVRVANATMEKAIRVVSIERGYDPRDFTLVAFGGAGGLHACELALALGIPRVIVPELPGALSAYGILVSDVVKDYSRTVLLRGSTETWRGREGLRQHVERTYAELQKLAQRDVRTEGWKGKLRLTRTADVRYRGQGYELNVLYGPSVLEAFHAEHQRRYGYSHREREVEIVTLRLRAAIAAPQITPQLRERPARRQPRSTQAWFSASATTTAIYEREALPRRTKLPGPAIITEYSATTVIPPGMRFHVDPHGALVIETSRPDRADPARPSPRR